MDKKTEAKGEKAQPQLLRRIDRNSVVGNSDYILELVMSDKSKTHLLYRVGGIAGGLIRGESQYGGWIKLNGRFKAINAKGEEFVSGAAFLPPDLSQMIADRMDKSEDGSIQFLFDVFARYDSSLATKYGYITEPVRNIGVADPLDALFAQASAPALAGPGNKGLLEGPGKGTEK